MHVHEPCFLQVWQAQQGLPPHLHGQILLKYENGENASILNPKAITMGFPFESIREQQVRNKLMKYLLANLTKIK